MEKPNAIYQYSIDDIDQVAQDIWEAHNRRKNWLFYGQVGAGKTTFIKAICRLLNVPENTQSPTFSLINEYEIQHSNLLLYHIDLYRLDDIEEAMGIDIEAYTESVNYCFIEWPEIIEPLLPDDVVKLNFEIIDHNSRKIIIL